MDYAMLTNLQWLISSNLTHPLRRVLVLYSRTDPGIFDAEELTHDGGLVHDLLSRELIDNWQ